MKPLIALILLVSCTKQKWEATKVKECDRVCWLSDKYGKANWYDTDSTYQTTDTIYPKYGTVIPGRRDYDTSCGQRLIEDLYWQEHEIWIYYKPDCPPPNVTIPWLRYECYRCVVGDRITFARPFAKTKL